MTTGQPSEQAGGEQRLFSQASFPETYETALVGPLFQAAQLLSQAVQTAMDADGTFLAINNGVSQSVPHVHVHIIPRKKGDGLKGFFWPRHPYRDAAHAEETRASIAARLG